MILWSFINHLLIGAILSFIGSLPFGLINITTSQVSIKQGLKSAIWFALGATTIEILQSFLSISFADLITKENVYEDIFKWFSFGLFVILAIYYFYFNESKPIDYKLKKSNKLALILRGGYISMLNFMAFPYWIFYYTYLTKHEFLTFYAPMDIGFSLGVGLGTFGLLCLYAYYAQKLIQKFAIIDQYINKIIGIIFLILAGISYFQI